MADGGFDDIVPDKSMSLLPYEVGKLGGNGGQPLARTMHHEPLAHDGERLHIQHHQSSAFEFTFERVYRYDAQSQSFFYPLLDGSVGIHFHADGQVDTAFGEKAFDKIQHC